MRPADREELDWTAFRYIAGELSAAESGEFERRLADDAEACEAVERAVKLAWAIQAAGPVETPHGGNAGRPRRRRAVALAASLAACLLVAFLCHQFLVDHEAAPSDSGRTLSPSTDELAMVWNQTRIELDDDPGASWSWQPPEASDLPAFDEDARALSVPDWMLAAIAAWEAGGDRPEEGDG